MGERLAELDSPGQSGVLLTWPYTSLLSRTLKVKHPVLEVFYTNTKNRIVQWTPNTQPLASALRNSMASFSFTLVSSPPLSCFGANPSTVNYCTCKYSSMNRYKIQTLKKYLTTIPFSHLRNIDIFIIQSSSWSAFRFTIAPKYHVYFFFFFSVYWKQDPDKLPTLKSVTASFQATKKSLDLSRWFSVFVCLFGTPHIVTLQKSTI